MLLLHWCQKVLLHSINGHLRSSLFYDYLLVSDVLDINDLLDTRSLGMYSACMAPHFPALLCSVYRHCSFGSEILSCRGRRVGDV